ncbi:MAG TPA: hypothetical protein VHM88_25630 [Candidatus Acidoferrales bacterium]|nr:hypothetical protein [Candidatus Acidoferrales bacterium]
MTERWEVEYTDEFGEWWNDFRHAYLDQRREPTADDLLSPLRQAEPISTTQADCLGQARESLGGLVQHTALQAGSAVPAESAVSVGTRLRRKLDLS